MQIRWNYKIANKSNLFLIIILNNQKVSQYNQEYIISFNIGMTFIDAVI